MAHWRDITGAEYPFYITDGTTLKTVIRSNPGLLLLRHGVVINKWSHNGLPTAEELAKPLEKSAPGKTPPDEVSQRVTLIVLCFVLPLFVLTLADRTLAVDEVGPTEEKAKQHAIGSGARAVAASLTGLRHKARPTFLHEISQSI